MLPFLKSIFVRVKRSAGLGAAEKECAHVGANLILGRVPVTRRQLKFAIGLFIKTFGNEVASRIRLPQLLYSDGDLCIRLP